LEPFPCSAILFYHAIGGRDILKNSKNSPRTALGGIGGGKDFDGVDHGVAPARLHDDKQSDNDDDSPVDTVEEFLGSISQREDVACVDDREDVSIGVGVGARVGVVVSGLGVCLGVSG